MDEVTQQNSALVEENAATARTLEDQQAAMNEQVRFFRFEDADVAALRSAGRRGHRAPAKPSPQGSKRQIRAVAVGQDWQEF